MIKFNHLGEISGLWLNIDKMELVPLGDLHFDLSQITGNLLVPSRHLEYGSLELIALVHN